ncbi:uncharacterized protein LOC135333189 [Halichondria panicea]|uniref:uncharacterized protein LOC135333189 n=1 Tax=Halichondria panicea TaxID=6063 RepID=UPI00312B4920
MESVTTPTSKSKCFSFWPNRRRKAASKVRISWPDVEENAAHVQEPLCIKPEPRMDAVCFSKGGVSTFASCSTGSKPYSQRMTIRPFFGIYADSSLTFDIKRSSSTDSLRMLTIRVSIQEDGSDTRKALNRIFVSRNKRSGQDDSSQNSVSLKDRCIAFANAIDTDSKTENIASACKQPSSLFFLCKKQVLLHLGEINPANLPKTEAFEDLKLRSTRNIFIRVYQADGLMLRMKVKTSMSINELKWMICGRLPSSVHPSHLSLYEFDSLDVLPADSILQPNQSLLHCTIDQSPVPSPTRPRVVARQPSCYMISLIGKDIDSIIADPSISFYHFQELVKTKFGLKSSSYLYFPNIGKTARSEDCGIKMSTVIDKSTICLIDSMRRNLPIVDGVPLAMSKYEKLSAYSGTIRSLGITPSSPVIAFEVTGPTIPISFRAAIQDRGNFNYSVVSDRVHAVSVNPNWTIRTLLKYVECISKIPCVGISLNSEILPVKCNVSTHLTCRCWLARSSSKTIELAKDLPTIIHS